MEELGVALPALSELFISLRLWAVGPLLGALVAGAVVWVAFLRRPRISAVVTLVAGVVMTPMALLGLCHMAAFRYLIVEQVDMWGERSSVPEPGVTSALAAEVIEGFRASVARGVGTAETPGGRTVHYMILSGPGLPPPPATLPAYAEARAHPGFVLLPWGPTTSTREHQLEPFFPTGVSGGVPLTSLDRVLELAEKGRTDDANEPWVFGRKAFLHITADDTPTLTTPGVVAVPDSGGYSYGLRVGPSRTDTTTHPGYLGDPEPGTVNRGDDFSAALYEVYVMVYRDYDEAEGAAILAAPRHESRVVPWSNVPAAQFMALVRR
jgi:hypothetical protein